MSGGFLKVKSKSEEIVYIEEGEGCLSINRPTTGIVPRHARMTVQCFDEYGVEYEIRVREEISVAFQHELDHLEGKLYVDLVEGKLRDNEIDGYGEDEEE